MLGNGILTLTVSWYGPFFRNLRPGGLARRVLGLGSEVPVIVVDELRVFVFFLAAEEIHRFRDDLATVALDALTVGPFGVVDAAPHQHLHALVAELLNRLAQPVEADDPVPFGLLHPVAVLVPQDLAVRVARPRCGQGEVGDLGAALCCAGFRGLADVACEDDDILHVFSPLLLPAGPSLRRDPAKTVGRRLHRSEAEA